jgi:imidazolonepropionase-like amidohydrolase
MTITTNNIMNINHVSPPFQPATTNCQHLFVLSSFVLLGIALLAPSPALAWNPEIPGALQKKPVAIVGATIYPMVGDVIESGTILFQDGKISAVGTEVQLPDDCRKISGKGLRVYPGLFDSYSQIGLTEVNSTRATVDHRELGQMNPNVQAHLAVNPDSEIIPVTRANGILLALSAPTGGRISGQSAVLQLDGWTFEDLTLQANVGLHVRWPGQGAIANFGASSGGGGDASASMRTYFKKVEDYRAARTDGAHPIDLKLEAMLPVLTGKLPLIVHADSARTIQSAVAFCAEYKLRMILIGGYDAEHCAELLKAHNVPVVIAGVHRLPMRRSDPFDAAYTLPERLRQKGVTFCIAGVERFGAPNVRNLPYQAGTAVAYGLPEDEAMKAITLRPAEIYGVADRVGSLQVGKDATLIVTNGSPLETPTRVLHAFVQGRDVSLNNRHTRLYRKYRARYEP